MVQAHYVVGRLMAQALELHVHVEGTIAPETQLVIADRNGIELPYDSPEGVAAYQAERRSTGSENLANFLECLGISRGVLRTPADFHTITVEFLERSRQEEVRYVELMFDPHRDDIVGIGLDNYETPGFPSAFEPTYRAARDRDYRLTSHCDVNQPDSIRHIRDCIELLGVERIDHGLNAIDDPGLLELVADRDVALTGCPTFYEGRESSPPERLEMHRRLLDAGARISLNTDDPAQFGSGWLTNTIHRAMVAAPFTREEIVRFTEHAVASAWIDDAHRAELATELRGFVAAG